MTKALVLVGSPRGKKSTSTSIGVYLMGKLAEKGLDVHMLWINRQVVSEERLDELCRAVEEAQIVVLTAPLYDDCQPAIVTRTMEKIAERGRKFDGKKRFFPVINCGFPEPEQITAVAIAIYHRFAAVMGLKWSGSLALGAGEFLQGSAGKSLEDLGRMSAKVRVTLDGIAQALASHNSYPDKSLRAAPNFFYLPLMARLFNRLNNHFWKSRAKKNGGVVDARPYTQ